MLPLGSVKRNVERTDHDESSFLLRRHYADSNGKFPGRLRRESSTVGGKLGSTTLETEAGLSRNMIGGI